VPNEKSPKPRGSIKMSDNLIVGNGTIIRAEGDYDIDAKRNRQFGDSTLVDLSRKAEEPKNDKAPARDHWYKRPIGIVALSVVAILIAAFIMGSFTHAWRLAGFEGAQ
jgi:hypothetical protein